ncbi:MAG TPA: group II truncated hemoglobin [Burkholderiaceae bacterium]|nr:group II truncated hemoglobin [Burkholderiaceae bacterium]
MNHHETTTDASGEAAEPTAFDLIGGEPGIAALVARFYDLMERDAAYAELRAIHAPDLGAIRDKLSWYLTGWLGGPDLYERRFGHPRLRARHLPFSIGTLERDQWVACMTRALDDTVPNEPLRAGLLRAMAQLADHMRNRAD